MNEPERQGKAAKALLNMPAPKKHKRPAEPTKKDLERKFVLRVNRNDRPTIKEVE